MDETIASSDENESEDGREGVGSEQVTASLRHAILSGRYQPGSRIRQEALAEEFGTSRIPVRMALRRLESEGLVTLIANSGAWVARLDMKECVEIYMMRERLEPLALEEAAPNISAETLARMSKLQDEIERTADVEDFLRLDREFHLLSYDATEMPRLNREIERFWNSTQHYRRAFSHAVGPEGLALASLEHRLLLAALERRDGIESGRVIWSHIRRTRLELMKRPELFEIRGKRR